MQWCLVCCKAKCNGSYCVLGAIINIVVCALRSPGTRQLLDTAAKVFQAHSSSLQAKVHSTYQRSIASTLTKMQLMHVLEDSTTGEALLATAMLTANIMAVACKLV